MMISKLHFAKVHFRVECFCTERKLVEGGRPDKTYVSHIAKKIEDSLGVLGSSGRMIGIGEAEFDNILRNETIAGVQAFIEEFDLEDLTDKETNLLLKGFYGIEAAIIKDQAIHNTDQLNTYFQGYAHTFTPLEKDLLTMYLQKKIYDQKRVRLFLGIKSDVGFQLLHKSLLNRLIPFLETYVFI